MSRKPARQPTGQARFAEAVGDAVVGVAFAVFTRLVRVVPPLRRLRMPIVMALVVLQLMVPIALPIFAARFLTDNQGIETVVAVAELVLIAVFAISTQPNSSRMPLPAPFHRERHRTPTRRARSLAHRLYRRPFTLGAAAGLTYGLCATLVHVLVQHEPLDVSWAAAQVAIVVLWTLGIGIVGARFRQ